MVQFMHILWINLIRKKLAVLAIFVCIGLLGTITVSQAQSPYVNAADVINSSRIRQGKIKSVLISTEFDETERIRLAQALHMLNIYLSHPIIYPSVRNCAVKYTTDRNSLNTDTPYSGTIYSRLGDRDVRRYITSPTFPSRSQQEQQKFNKEQAVDNMLLNLAVFGSSNTIYIDPFYQEADGNSYVMAQVRRTDAIEWRPINGYPRESSEIRMFVNTVALDKLNSQDYNIRIKPWVQTIFHELLHIMNYRHASGNVTLNDWASVRGNSVYETSRCLDRGGLDRRPDGPFLLPSGEEVILYVD